MVLIVRLLSHDLHCASPPFPGAIASSTFYSSDAADAPTERVITLAPGAYEIAVSGTNFRTGPASFRLLDLGTAAPLAIGQPVSGSLNPVAETDMFRFEAVAGERSATRRVGEECVRTCQSRWAAEH